MSRILQGQGLRLTWGTSPWGLADGSDGACFLPQALHGQSLAVAGGGMSPPRQCMGPYFPLAGCLWGLTVLRPPLWGRKHRHMLSQVLSLPPGWQRGAGTGRVSAPPSLRPVVRSELLGTPRQQWNSQHRSLAGLALWGEDKRDRVSLNEPQDRAAAGPAEHLVGAP